MNINRIAIFGYQNPDGQMLRRVLVHHGYLADALDLSADIVAYSRAARPLAIVMDAESDRENTCEALSRLRASDTRTLVVIVGQAIDSSYQIECFTRGADDFIVQPVQPVELLSRLELLISRKVPALSAHGLAERTLQALTATEKGILAALHEAMPEVLSREEIMWQAKRQRVAPDDRTLDVYISHIRKKLTLIAADIAIETVRGRGFRLIRADRSAEVETVAARRTA